MSRKPKKGYFVRGQFVAEGSELDLQLKTELKGGEISRTDLKRESDELQKLGESLLDLGSQRLQALGLPERLLDALVELRRITNFEGRRRQSQYVGKLMRLLDAGQRAAAAGAVAEHGGGSAAEKLTLHEAERWRERLADDEQAAADWLRLYPATDAQQLRALVRQARKDRGPVDQDAISRGLAPRQGRAWRELFQLVRAQLAAARNADDDAEPQADDDTLPTQEYRHD